MKGFREFEFALTDALMIQLLECFDEMESSDLSDLNTANIPNGQGVYQLFFDNELVYVGKTDSEAGLQPRLSRHAAKIKGRLNLDPKNVSFKAIQVLVFSAMELESLLIKHYTQLGSKPAWNNSGFGSNDPGRNRDGSKLKIDHFDALYPIDLSVVIDVDYPEKPSARQALDCIKQVLPYLLRYDKKGKASKQLESNFLEDVNERATAKDHIINVMKTLESGWQVTALSGYVIIYLESTDYNHGDIILRT